MKTTADKKQTSPFYPGLLDMIWDELY